MMIDLRSATLSVDWTGSNKKEAIEEEIAHDLFKILTRVFIMTHHIKVEYYYADFHEQMVFHLEKEEQEKVKQLLEQNDYSALRDFIEELEDERGCDADSWWYDEPFNLRMSIEVDGEIIESESSHASAFVNGDSMINAQSLCPTLRYLNRICDEAGEDPEDFNEGNEILMVTAGNDAGEQMLKGAEFWNDYADKFFGANFSAPETWWYVLGIALFVIFLSMCFGLADGLIIANLKVPPFLATLGMQTVIYGIACIYSDAKPIGGLRQDYTAIATSQMFKIGTFSFKWLFLFALIGGIVFWFLYNMTRYGKYMYAIGGNENAAEVSGVNVRSSIIKIYALAGCMYGLAGFILAAKSAGASVNLGQGYELEAIAACTIGGVSTGGGVGKVSGILLGVLVFELLKSSMQFLGINPYVQQVVQGIVIIVAVAFDVRKYLKRR